MNSTPSRRASSHIKPKARAGEYDESIKKQGRYETQEPEDPAIEGELARAAAALRELGIVDEALELACGTGIWTRELLEVAHHITAIDASPEMIARNRAKLGDKRVRYQIADLFEWEPEQQCDLTFFAFWLSHVPPAHLDTFLAKVARSVRPQGHLFIVDEPAQGQHLSGPMEGEMYQRRNLLDGREFTIVKVYYEPETIAARLGQFGFENVTYQSGEYFFHMSAQHV